MPGGQLKRPGPPLGEHSVIQHTPPASHPLPPHPIVEDTPSPSKRRKSSDQVHNCLFLFILSLFLFSSVCFSSVVNFVDIFFFFFLSPIWLQVSQSGMQRFSGQSPSPPQQKTQTHHQPPKPAFWNPIHKDNNVLWKPHTADKKHPHEHQVRTDAESLMSTRFSFFLVVKCFSFLYSGLTGK